MAERERFELSVPCGTLAFQASALDHYATSPGNKIVRVAYLNGVESSRGEENAGKSLFTIVWRYGEVGSAHSKEFSDAASVYA